MAAPQGAAISASAKRSLEEANTAMQAGHFADAALQYDAWLKANGDSDAVLFALGVCYVQLGRNADAVAPLEKYLKHSPNSAAGHAALGIALLDGTDATRAREHLQRALQLNPNQADAAEALTRVNLMNGRPADALAVITPFATSASATETQLQLMGEALLATGKAKDAADLIEKRLRAVPLSGPELYALAARAALNYGDLNRTADIAERGTLYYPDSHIARVYLSLPAPFLAERVGKRIEALQQHPEPYEMVALGRILIDADPLHHTRANEIATKLLRDAVALKPGYASAHYNLGRSLAAADKTDEALAEWNKALALHPGPDLQLDIYTQIGIAHANRSEFPDAEKAYVAALEINRKLPQRRPESAMEYVNFLRTVGRSQEAEKLLDQVLAWNPLFPQAHLERAKIAAARSQWTRVIDDAEFALRNARDDTSVQRGAHTLLVRAYSATGQKDKAAPHAEWVRAHR